MKQGFSVFPRTGRTVWYARIVSDQTGQWTNRATPYRLDDPSGERKALRWAETRTKRFKLTATTRTGEGWKSWVRAYIEDRYRLSPLTRTRYLSAWENWQLYLDEKKVRMPSRLDYNIGIGFIPWRTAQKRSCGKFVLRNTAIVDLKVMSLVMREAVRRGFALGNPLERTGIKRDPAKQKAELTGAEIAIIRGGVAKLEVGLPVAQRWMSTSFEIALHQGCRLRETQVAMADVNEATGRITFHGKGGKTIPTALHPALLPLMRELRAAGATHTCALPQMAAKLWWELRKELNLSHTCFHATRVTVITTLARSKVPEQQAMRFVGHSSRVVHQIYQKLQVEDLTDCVAALQFPTPPCGPDKPASG